MLQRSVNDLIREGAYGMGKIEHVLFGKFSIRLDSISLGCGHRLRFATGQSKRGFLGQCYELDDRYGMTDNTNVEVNCDYI